MASFQVFNCSGTGPSLLPIGTRSCGLRYYSDKIDSCCGDAPISLLRDCYQYCSYDGSINEWVGCVSTNQTTPRIDAFCQDIPNGTVTNSIQGLSPNSAVRGSSPKLSCLLVGVILLALFTSGTSAMCSSYKQTDNYTKGGRQVRLEDPVQCENSNFCARTVLLNQSSNRTLNWGNGAVLAVDASSPSYDEFFSFLSQQTGLLFPAVTAVSVSVDAVFQSNATSYLSWVPYLDCTLGVASDCGTSVPGVENGTEVQFEACGPVLFGTRGGPDGEFFKVVVG